MPVNENRRLTPAPPTALLLPPELGGVNVGTHSLAPALNLLDAAGALLPDSDPPPLDGFEDAISAAVESLPLICRFDKYYLLPRLKFDLQYLTKKEIFWKKKRR